MPQRKYLKQSLTHLYGVLIGSCLWLPRKCQDAGIECDGDMNVHFLLVPHRYLKHMNPSILQDEIAVYHHGNHIITSYFSVT